MLIYLESTYDRKWWNLIFICLVRGRYLCSLAISKAHMLSSNTLQWMRDGDWCGTRSWLAISCKRCIMGMASLNAQLRPMYSDSLLLRAMCGWSWLFQQIGQPVYVMQYPCLDFAVSIFSVSSLQRKNP